MHLSLVDHLLVLSVVLLLPLRGLFARPRHATHASASLKRRQFYRQSTRMHVGLIICAIAVCLWSGHRAGVLGITVPQLDRVMVGLVAAMCGLALHLAQGVLALRRIDRTLDASARLGHIQALLPRDARERRGFYLLSVVAAVSEEMLFRAYLLAYLLVLLPWQAAAALAVLAFALGHLYQGPKGVAQTALIGGALMAMYLLTHSIWPGVLFHAGFNMISGEIGGRLLVARQRLQPPAPGGTGAV